MTTVAVKTGLTSASGFLSLLEETEPTLQVYALENLNSIVDEFWAEISDSIKHIEVLNENEQFPARDLAALVASKVYYHIGYFDSAMHYALLAGKFFNINEDSQYVRTLVLKCIDEYIRQQEQGEKDDKDEGVPLKSLERVVEEVFAHSLAIGEHKYALGIALESRRLDKVKDIITSSSNIHSMLDYCFTACMKVVISRDFRQQVLKLLVSIYKDLSIVKPSLSSSSAVTSKAVDWTRMCEILIFLDDPDSVSHILCSLVGGSANDLLTAYQIAFDLCETAPQQFRTSVRNYVINEAGPDSEQKRIQAYYQEMLAQKEKNTGSGGEEEDTSMETDQSSSKNEKGDISADERKVRVDNLATILSGTTSINLFLEFLHRNNHTDKLILKNMKTAMDSRSSVVYSSIIIAHAFMNAGTTNDFFLRDNLDWLSSATNWSKFTATAGIGVIQKGHFKQSRTILAPYLPQGSGGAGGGIGSPYSEGGALYALGLIHANHGEEATDYLRQALANAGTNEIVQHGACLGLGVAAMSTKDTAIFEELKDKVLFTDSAVAGEAAGMAMGLVMLGGGAKESHCIEEMVTYAHDTQHEKIIRGLAMGLALIMCGREEEADGLIEQLGQEKDPILRYGGMYTIALAYAGTANNKAIRKLLHVAVSDVSDDVRRAAVTALGFLLITQPEQCPKLVQLLSESYNAHVRYGATLAVGISCAGTGLKEAVDLLEPLATGDSVDFVRQGALVALAMVLVQTSAKQEPRVDKIRKMFSDKIADKHEDIMAKFGACLAQGIIDAGGRNCTISPALSSAANVGNGGGGAQHKNISAIVGLALFTQYWYWHPLAHFLSLSFTPTALIGLNKDLKMPVFKFRSNARPSLFAYPPELKPPTAKAAPKLKSAELSITKKAKIRAQQKKKEDGKMETDESSSSSSSSSNTETTSAAAATTSTDNTKTGTEEATPTTESVGGDKMETDKGKEKVAEAEWEELKNPARVTLKQRRHLGFDLDERYAPVKKGGEAFGIVMLRDRRPGEEETFVTPSKPAIGGESGDDGDEPAPPEPFEYDPEKENQ